jgi:hypothetical protein
MTLPLDTLLQQSFGQYARFHAMLVQTVPPDRFQTEHGFLVEHYLNAMAAKLRSWGFSDIPSPHDDAGWKRAKEAGFLFKTWLTRRDSRVRKKHNFRHLEERRIDERFSVQFKGWPGPMHPRDPIIHPGDRINCRCRLAFSME